MNNKNNNEYISNLSSNKNLKKKSIRSGSFMFLSQLSIFVLKMMSTFILARLLLPEDFGLIAMVMAITGFVALFKDLGLSLATIQKTDITHNQISTLFWINVLISFCIMLITFAIAPIVAWFYNEPRLINITMILALAFVFSGFSIQHQALLSRKMYFGKLAIIEIFSTIMSIIVAVLVALQFNNYWAIVFMHLTLPLFISIGSWFACNWRPGLPTKNSGVRSMLVFGGNITGFTIVNYFARNLDNILIGKFCGSSMLGLYSKAYQIVMLPIANIRGPLYRVAMPALSQLKDNPDKYKNYYLKMLSLISFISLPVITFLFLFSEEIIMILFGSKWLEMNLIFKILAVSSLLQPVAGTRGLILISLGKTQRYLIWGITNSILTVIAFLIGIQWGTEGVAYAYAIEQNIILIPSLFYCLYNTPIKVKDFVITMSSSLIRTFTMGVLIYFISKNIHIENRLISISIFLLMSIFIYAILWLILKSGRKTLIEFIGYFKLLKNS